MKKIAAGGAGAAVRKEKLKEKLLDDFRKMKTFEVDEKLPEKSHTKPPAKTIEKPADDDWTA